MLNADVITYVNARNIRRVLDVLATNIDPARYSMACCKNMRQGVGDNCHVATPLSRHAREQNE